MKFRVGRMGIDIIPEDEQDEAYIEDTLGLKKHHASTLLVRENAHGLSCMGKLTTHPFPEPEHLELELAFKKVRDLARKVGMGQDWIDIQDAIENYWEREDDGQ